MSGVSEDLLKEMGVRLIAIDRPGYGLSTPNPLQTFKSAAADISNIADILEMGEKIYILGYSTGGAYTWAAARYIPERIAGIAFWAPVGNYWWKVCYSHGYTCNQLLYMKPHWLYALYWSIGVVQVGFRGHLV